MVGDEIEQQLEAPGVDGGEQAVEGGEIAEHRLHAGIVSDVIAEVGHR